jgi:hypothetical protein
MVDGEMVTKRVSSFLRSFLSGDPPGAGDVRVCTEDGAIVFFGSHDDPYCYEGKGHVPYEEVLGLLNVRVGKSRRGVVERVEMIGEGVVGCRFVEDSADEIINVIAEVMPQVRAGRGCEVCAPLWVIDLGVRINAGEKFLFVEPQDFWPSTVEMLGRRDVQAIVVVPSGVASAGELCDGSVCVLEPSEPL